MCATPTLNLLGAGRVGQTLAHLWQRHNILQVQDVLTRSPGSASTACGFIGAGHPVSDPARMRSADIWMLALPDAAIASVAAALAKVQRPAPGAVAFHCSGALDAAALRPLQEAGWTIASAHCILSFVSPLAAINQFAGTPCALEGQAIACSSLSDAFTAIGARCFALQGQDKLLYHAAAVFATNFLPVLQSVAERLWHDCAVPDELVVHLRQTLGANAVANMVRLGPKGALTGPAARGDLAAIERQLAALKKWDPASGAAYEAMMALALRLAQPALAP
jgi:predicted short-subunit dehydrogenase-like oxidoreductase (DUF2520 family)